MHIQSNTRYLTPQLSTAQLAPKMVTGTRLGLPRLPEHDTVDLRSHKARELPADAIEHHSVQLFFSTEINERLDKIFADKPPEARKAFDHILERNFFNSQATYTDEERAALIEVGLTQGKYLADQYMADEKNAAEFLDTLHLLAGVAKTRKVDPATGSVSYVELPQKPHGAPNDYVNPSKLMERHDPEAYKKMQAATTNQTEKVSMLIQFVKKLQHRPDWIAQYRNEQATLLSDLKNTKIANRFENVNTKDATEFVHQMNTLAEKASFSTFTPLLQTNLASFMKIVAKKTS
ncbi:hypothetical protein ABER61_25950 [Brevibacillus formosus]|uniref:Uncharacterized protein n=1 Tax=Brevibacillus formosus TaxID=54913 RepID=A0A837KN68_9BACL|nr:hypothetical protein [Brevibacillus formosus]KLH98096.1 hypothetical protein AA984_13830 [Brevibacillus formosus]MED1957032.1 hypothetical protein [Brevibacillus formosus]PSJ96397.1 hypothetical protein C7R91_11630 [Brevibacillus formosus]GED59341.1 hypothetical protein BFO01nite_34730 [Brevibacillus formosus]